MVRGVYVVGAGVLIPLALETAVLLACAPRALLSHRSAAAAWGILVARPGVVDVTVGGRDPGRRPGVRTHVVAAIDARDVTTRHGLPLTSPARTLVDLAAVLAPRDLSRAYDEALVQRLTNTRAVTAALARRPRGRGAPTLRRLLEAERSVGLTRSEAERRLLELIEAAGLPRPETNVRVHGHEVDVLWRAQRLVIEVDGYRFHSTRAAFERDRRRDARLQVTGLRVVRVTWRRLVDEPHGVVADLVRLLG